MRRITQLALAAALVCGSASYLNAGPIYGTVYPVQVAFAAANTADDVRHVGSTEPYQFDSVTFTGDFGPYALGTTPERILPSQVLIAPNMYMSWTPDAVTVHHSQSPDSGDSTFTLMAWMFDPFSEDPAPRNTLLVPGRYEAAWVYRSIQSESFWFESIQYSGATITISSPEVVEIPPAPLPEPSAMPLIPSAVGGGYLIRRNLKARRV